MSSAKPTSADDAWRIIQETPRADGAPYLDETAVRLYLRALEEYAFKKGFEACELGERLSPNRVLELQEEAAMRLGRAIPEDLLRAWSEHAEPLSLRIDCKRELARRMTLVKKAEQKQ